MYTTIFTVTCTVAVWGQFLVVKMDSMYFSSHVYVYPYVIYVTIWQCNHGDCHCNPNHAAFSLLFHLSYSSLLSHSSITIANNVCGFIKDFHLQSAVTSFVHLKCRFYLLHGGSSRHLPPLLSLYIYTQKTQTGRII